MAIAVDIADVEGVAVRHVAVEQVAAYPGFRLRGIALAFIETQRTAAVARCDHHLGIPAGFELPTANSATDRADLRGLIFAVPQILEPRIPRQQVDLAIAIDIDRIYPLGVSRGALAALAGLSGEDRLERPRPGIPRIVRNLGHEQRLDLLVPEQELRMAGSLEVGKDLIVVLFAAATFDYVPLPRRGRIIVRIRIFPPPELIPLCVVAED